MNITWFPQGAAARFEFPLDDGITISPIIYLVVSATCIRSLVLSHDHR